MKFDNFIKNINLFLKEMGWSRNRFAKELGCDSSPVSKWLNLRQEPSFSYIVKILKVMNCTFEELVS